ncbi:hypothetical protein MS3_00001814 [Schistosoma haematobium]|uniref:Choline transporter-like protein n=1 Tax=Schistosoma haematobium TaxID=6185 RepID=A0A922LXS5_SCHHA|nr:hypothetical protein MS3_00001814 [Schistosoma haematobium]KAH9595960.1 hypothetical protein MS3_00001814 [Schistosoma haematobium]
MGDFKRVIHPTNSQGQVCGRDVPGKPYLFFFDSQSCLRLGPALVVTGCPTPQVCVASCPKYYWSWKGPFDQKLQYVRSLMICLGGVDANDPKFASQSIDQLVQDKQCAPYVYHSRSILGRCIPSQVSRLMGNGTGQVRDETGKPIHLMDAENQEVNGMEVVKSRKLVLECTTFFEKVVADLSQTWHVILVCISVSVVLSFCWIVLLRCCASVMVWTTLILFVALFSFGTGFCLYRWNVLRKTTEGSNDLEFSLDIASYFRLASTWLALGIIFAILLVIILLILIFLRKRIRVAIAILNEASKAVSTMTSVLFWPILPFILELIVIAQVLFVAISLRTISDPVGTKIMNDDPTVTPGFGDKARNDIREIFQLIPCDPLQNNSAGKACRFLYYGDRKYTIYLQFFNLFMFFWLINFVKSLTQMTLAGTFAEYYFSSHNQKSSSKCPLITSLFRSTFYHTGSLAFGSFLIALLQWLRVTLEYINAKLKKANNPVTDFLLKCLSCCFWLLEKFLRFLNRNAFIMIAIYGQSFCSASRSALSLLARNVVRLFVVDKVTDFILFIGKLVVVSIVGGMAYVYLEGILFKGNDFLSDAFTSNLHYAFVPLGIIILASYLVASLFSSVFEMGVDTIFLCFLEDLEKNDGSAERPYYMSKNLMNILGKRNAQLPQIKQAI